jgi:hypothetical protein
VQAITTRIHREPAVSAEKIDPGNEWISLHRILVNAHDPRSKLSMHTHGAHERAWSRMARTADRVDSFTS